MNFTAKSRYALKIMLDLAHFESCGPQKRHEVASRQSVPLDFMDQILIKLREHKLIHSTRGRSGGLALARPAESINLWEMFTAVEDNIYPVRCITSSVCELEATCISIEAWTDVVDLFRDNLTQRSLKATLEKWKKRQPRVKQKNATLTL